MRFDATECGKRIKALREENGFTQAQLAEQLNISLNHMKALERARRVFSLELMVELSVIFSVSLDYLVLGKASKTGYIHSELDTAIKILGRIKKEL